jgi:hypothetical protein
VLREGFAALPLAVRASVSEPVQGAATIFGTLASLAWAFFPKCPMCWAAYLSGFGTAGMQIPYPSKVQPMLIVMMLINIVSVWFRSRATRRITGFYFVCAGTLAVILAKTGVGWENLAAWGALLTFSGTLWSAVPVSPGRAAADKRRAQRGRERRGVGAFADGASISFDSRAETRSGRIESC